MLVDIEIKFVSKIPNHSDVLISHVGGIRADGQIWKLSEEEAIKCIESQKYEFYIKTPDRQMRVIVATRSNRKYLKTVMDRDKPNNLMMLPECP
jgi:hypothetical protein